MVNTDLSGDCLLRNTAFCEEKKKSNSESDNKL